MKKLLPFVVVTIALAGVAVTLIIQRRAGEKLRQNEASLQENSQRLAALTVEQRRLSNLVGQADNSPTEGAAAELSNLSRQAEALRQRTNELGQQLDQNRRSTPAPTASKPSPRPPEYYKRLHQLAGTKPRDAVGLVAAFRMYAFDHNDQFPSSLDQVAPYLKKEEVSSSGIKEFEIVYRGSPDELKQIPLASVALLRDRQTWIAPSGKMARVYGMANGAGQIVESDDNFKAWEQEHILPAPTASP